MQREGRKLWAKFADGGRFVRSAQDPNGPEPEKSAPYFNRGRNISTVLAALVVTYRFILLSIPIDGL